MFSGEKATTSGRAGGQWKRSRAGAASKSQAANRFLCLGDSGQSVVLSLKPCAEQGSDAGRGGIRPHGGHAKFKCRTLC